MNKRLALAILAQALIDVLEGTSPHYEDALEYVAKHPVLLKRLLNQMDDDTKHRWMNDLNDALGREK